MKKLCFVVLAAIAVSTLFSAEATANSLVNPSFEDPIAAAVPPFVGRWEPFSGGGTATSANGNFGPRTGAQELDLGIEASNNNFAGAFQDVEGLISGTPAEFSVWHKAFQLPVDVGVEMRIEWRNSVSGTEISRTANLTTKPTLDYSQLVLSTVVPAGVDTARVVYAIQTFGDDGGGTNTGFIFVDDASFIGVPEPASLALLALAGFGIVGIRRRSA